MVFLPDGFEFLELPNSVMVFVNVWQYEHDFQMVSKKNEKCFGKWFSMGLSCVLERVKGERVPRVTL